MKKQERKSLPSHFKKDEIQHIALLSFYLQKMILSEKNIKKKFFLQHFAYQGAGCSTWNKSVESKFGILLFKSFLKLISSHCLLPGHHIWISQLAYEFLKSIKPLSLSLSYCTNTTQSFGDFPSCLEIFDFTPLLFCVVFGSPVCLGSGNIQTCLKY